MMKEREAIEIERNWVDLPPELFPLILKNLPEIGDFVRSRAVCKPWCLSSSVSDLPHQFPWIIRLSRGPNLEFYSIFFKKVYNIRKPPCFSGRRLCRPAGGYMITSKSGNMSLVNPLNNSEFPLPVIHDCEPYFFPNNITWFNPLGFQIGDYMLVSDHDISVDCKPGDDRWDIIGPGHDEAQYRCYYLKGLFFRVEICTWITTIIDISSRKELYVIQPPKYEILFKMFFVGPFLVESQGEILSVCYNRDDKGTYYKFYIHRLEFGNGKKNPCWVNLGSIGDRILFFDFPLATGRGFCLRASDFAGFNGNCIYFINKTAYHLCDVHVIYMYDIENGETILIYTPFVEGHAITWFMPTLNHI